MSHYSNASWKSNNQIGTIVHAVRRCWSCGEIVRLNDPGVKRKSKVCDLCKEKLTDQEIKTVYAKHYKHMREQHRARKTRPDMDKHIYNSPFRKNA